MWNSHGRICRSLRKIAWVEEKKSHLKQVGSFRRRYDALGYHFHTRLSEETKAVQDFGLTIGKLETSWMASLPFLVWPARSRIGGGGSSVTLRLGCFTIFLQIRVCMNENGHKEDGGNLPWRLVE